MFVVRGVWQVLALLGTRLDHDLSRVALKLADVQEISAAPPPSQRLNVLWGAADGEEGGGATDPATRASKCLDPRNRGTTQGSPDAITGPPTDGTCRPLRLASERASERANARASSMRANVRASGKRAGASGRAICTCERKRAAVMMR